MPTRLDLPQGTLDLLILKTVALEPRHGVGVAERIAQITQGAVQVPPGSLYPALHRLERRGWLQPQWGASDANRKAKFYRLSAAGRRQLQAQTGAWQQLTWAVGAVLAEESADHVR